MKVIRNERIIFVDVDETLVHHEKLPGTEPINVPNTGCFRDILVYANTPMVKILLEEDYRGATIIVWSKGGYEWAEAVIKALQLEFAVDIIMSKPTAYLDDKEISEWLKDRVWISPETKYKQRS